MRDSLENIETGAAKNPMPKRFYKRVDVVETEDGFSIHLDRRAVKTPLLVPLLVANAAMAQLLADEWQEQEKHIDPITMPVTRLVNIAIDGISKDVQSVKEDIVRFASSDLLCYRAEGPEGLLTKQRQHWDPLIDWAHASLNAHFILVEGIVHVAQPGETIAAFSSHIGLINDPLALASLHTVTSITGSAIIALGVFKRAIESDEAWIAAHIDEDWQISQWGEDVEAKRHRELRKKDFEAAIKLMRTGDKIV